LCLIIEVFIVVKMHVVVFWSMTAGSSFEVGARILELSSSV